MSSDSPAPGPQNLFEEEVLGAKAGNRQSMNGQVVDDACYCQHGVAKDRGKASTARTEYRTVPRPNRSCEGERNGRAVKNINIL